MSDEIEIRILTDNKILWCLFQTDRKQGVLCKYKFSRVYFIRKTFNKAYFAIIRVLKTRLLIGSAQ